MVFNAKCVYVKFANVVYKSLRIDIMAKEIAILASEIDRIRSGLEHGRYSNEDAVCREIVKVLLQRLGWRTSDTTVCCREYKIANGRVDYALCDPPLTPIVLIEVKRVGNIEGAEEQLFSYAFHQGVPILILTDGKFWRFFYPFGIGPYEERLVCELDLSDTDSDHIAYQLQRYLSYVTIRNGVAVDAIADDYKKLTSERKASRYLPQTWRKLVDEADEFLIDLLAEATEDNSGHKPAPEQVLDFLKNLESSRQNHQNKEVAKATKVKARGKKPSNVSETTEADRNKVAVKVVEMRINASGSKPMSWRRIREELGLKNDQFHKVIRRSAGYRKAVIDRIKSLKTQEGGWEYSGKLESLTGIEITEEELQ